MNLFLIFILGFLNQAALATPAAPTSKVGGQGINLLEAILTANIIVQMAFLILIVMSIVSWAIILQKWLQIKQLEKNNAPLQDAFLKASSFEEIYNIARVNEEGSLGQIFIKAYNEMKKSIHTKTLSISDDQKPVPQKDKPLIFGIDNIERSLRQNTDNEIAKLEVGLGFLATTGNSCPFIGLFGTVFGIMNSFNQIAAAGSASLNVVAPGIAEALLATGVGLFAAIPASIFFNYFLGQIKKQELICNNFSTDFLNIAKRNFFTDQES